jgi:hypothetical protein
MHPSEKIHLIKRIAVTLATEEWRFIDLVLTQFGLPTAHSWEGSPVDYVLAMVRDADSDVLLQVADHLGLLEPGAVIPAVPDIWVPDHFRLFISHLSADKERAMNLQEALKASSISSFVAHIDIEPTREWQDEIELALRTADALAVIMTSEVASSNWVDQEIGIAIGRGLLVIPLLAGKNPYGFLGKYQGLSATGRKVKSVSEDVFKVLLTHQLTQRRMVEVIVSGFEQVNSWEGARAQMSLVEQIPRVDESLLQRIISAGQNNLKIAESYGVPGRIERLVAKYRA